MRVHVDTDTVTQERVLPAGLPLVGLHPEFVKKMGPYAVWSIDEPSADQRRCAFETGVMVLVEFTEPTLAELFPGTNSIAAEWAAKHGGEVTAKFWREISEETRARIRAIIKRAFEGKNTPFTDVVSEIRNAGVFGGEHARLVPTDLRKPECPYCQNALKKIPGAKTKCSQCGRFIYVRTRPEDGARVLVTEADAHRINEAWESTIREGVREPEELAAMIARTEVSQAQIGANFDVWKKSRMVKSVKWLAVGPDPCPVCKANAGQIRALGEPFPSGDMYPTAHPCCSCILIPAEFAE